MAADTSRPPLLMSPPVMVRGGEACDGVEGERGLRGEDTGNVTVLTRSQSLDAFKVQMFSKFRCSLECFLTACDRVGNRYTSDMSLS